MATYNFTDSWDNESFTVDGATIEFTQAEYAAANTYASNQGLNAGLEDSYGSQWAGGYDILNFGDFDYDDDGSGDWASMNSLVGHDDIVGGYAVAIDAEGEGFIQVTSNFNGYNSFGGTSDNSINDGILFDVWHLDGLDDGDYVTAQVISGTLTDAYLSVYGEVDSFETSSFNGNQVAWPYLQDDLLTVDSNNMALSGADYGDYNYTMTIVTDWKQCSAKQMKTFDWGTMDFYSTSQDGYEAWYADIDWGYVQYNEYTTASYKTTEWNEVQGNELDKSDLKYLMKKDTSIDNIKGCDLDLNVLSKKTKDAEMTGDKKDADIFLMKGQALKKQKGDITCVGGKGSDTFCLQKAKKSNLVIEDFNKSSDYINTSFVSGKLQLQVKKGDTYIKKGSDLLAIVEDTKGLKFSKNLGIYS